MTKSDENLSVIENKLRSFWTLEAAAIFIVHRRYSIIFSCLYMSKTGMIEIERVRRFEKRMNLFYVNQLTTTMGLILYTSYQELNIFKLRATTLHNHQI